MDVSLSIFFSLKTTSGYLFHLLKPEDHTKMVCHLLKPEENTGVFFFHLFKLEDNTWMFFPQILKLEEERSFPHVTEVMTRVYM